MTPWERSMDALGRIMAFLPGLLFLAIFPPAGIAWIAFFCFVMVKESNDKQKAERKLAQEREFKDLQSRAVAGDADASFAYGKQLIQGRLVQQSIEMGVRWIRFAAHTKGQKDAILFLADSYAQGLNGIEQDLPKAIELYDLVKSEFDVRDKIERINKNLELQKFESDKREELKRRDEVERMLFGASLDRWEEYKSIFSLCDSEPEVILVKALAMELRLKPVDESLVGDYLIEIQKQIGRYRVDFLINRKLIVEVDGKQYHENPGSFESDRRRDQELLMKGFITARFPASQIYQSPVEAVRTIVGLAATHNPQR